MSQSRERSTLHRLGPTPISNSTRVQYFLRQSSRAKRVSGKGTAANDRGRHVTRTSFTTNHARPPGSKRDGAQPLPPTGVRMVSRAISIGAIITKRRPQPSRHSNKPCRISPIARRCSNPLQPSATPLRPIPIGFTRSTNRRRVIEIEQARKLHPKGVVRCSTQALQFCVQYALNESHCH